MTGPEHYKMAQEIVEAARLAAIEAAPNLDTLEQAAQYAANVASEVARAQVHATLALAAATALAIPDECVGERLVAAWHEAGAW